MSGLVEFLLARIAEDEAAAQRVGPTRYYLHDAPRRGTAETAEGVVLLEVDGHSSFEAGALFDHNARHQPGRVLAECEAKRRIVEQVIYLRENLPTSPEDPEASRSLEALEWVCAVHAEVYADHPEYDEEWKP